MKRFGCCVPQFRSYMQKAVIGGCLLLAGMSAGAVCAAVPGEAEREYCDYTVLVELEAQAARKNPDALLTRGIMLAYGHCLGADRQAGVAHLVEALALGQSEAAFFLARIYEDRGMAEFNPVKSRQYYGIAAEGGHADAQHALGMMLLRGDGGPEEPDLGAYWLGSAASEGHAFSALIMGWVHERGHYGWDADGCLARDWYEASFLLGLEDARQHVSRIDAGWDCL